MRKVIHLVTQFRVLYRESRGLLCLRVRECGWRVQWENNAIRLCGKELVHNKHVLVAPSLVGPVIREFF